MNLQMFGEHMTQALPSETKEESARPWVMVGWTLFCVVSGAGMCVAGINSQWIAALCVFLASVILGGGFVGACMTRWSDLPLLALVGGTCMCIVPLVVEFAQPPPSDCVGGDCEQGYGLGFILGAAIMSLLLALPIGVGFALRQWRQPVA
jgi:hypothetical protein